MDVRKWQLLAIAFAALVGAHFVSMPFRSEPSRAQEAAGEVKPVTSGTNKSEAGPTYTKLGETPDPAAIGPRKTEDDTCYATLEKFQRIKAHMSQAVVNNIMRCEGELVAQIKVSLFSHRQFVWRSRDGSGYATVVYYGDHVDATMQEGLQ
jgi:hypothetical protein